MSSSSYDSFFSLDNTMNSEEENNEDHVTAFVALERHNSDDDSEMATSVSGFAAAENRKRSFTELYQADDSVIGKFHRPDPTNQTTLADGKNFEKSVQVPAAPSAGTRSQYHSIQQLSQSGRPEGSCGLFSGAEATVYGHVGQAWLGCGQYPIDAGSEGEEDTLKVLRSLLRRYDNCATPRLAVELFESDEAVSGRASLSGDEFDEGQSPIGQQVPLRLSPSSTTLEAKRARVEHIVSNIRTPTYTENAGGPATCYSGRPTSLDGRRRSKRKQTVPQQHDSASFNNDNHQSLNGNTSDDNDDDEQTVSSRKQTDDDEQELRQQLRVVQSRLEDMYAKYAKSVYAKDRLSASRSPLDYKCLESDSTVDDKAERLTNLLKAEFRHVVDGLVDRFIQRFLTKHFAGRQPASQTSALGDDRPPPDFPRLSPVTSLPVFVPPSLFPPLPFPVGGGDMQALRRAYAERCAYVDALVQRARTTCATDRDDVTLNYNSSTSGPVSCPAVTSASTDHCSMMSVISSRCLLPDQQLLQPRTQV